MTDSLQQRQGVHMVVVRMVFHLHPGRADEAVEGLKRSADRFASIWGDTVIRTRILTDMSGPWDTVIQEHEVTSLGDWETLRSRMFGSEEWQEMVAEAREMSAGAPALREGRTEFYTLEATIEN